MSNNTDWEGLINFREQLKKEENIIEDNLPTIKDEYVKEIFNKLNNYSPCFPIHSENVSILKTPTEFYNSLIKNIKQSKNRIILSSLYLGIGENELNLIKEIDNSLNENKELKITILLDYLRGTRLSQDNKSSLNILLPLITKYGLNRINISFYHTPNLNGIWKRILPQRVNEIIGVQHMKLYIFDNNLLISGANLSDWYFIDRQDRYMLIKEEKEVIDFFEGLVKTIGNISYQLLKDGNLKLKDFIPDPILQPLAFKIKSEDLIKNYFYNKRNWLFNFNNNLNDNLNNNTWIFPTIQMGQLNVRHEQFIISGIINSSINKLDITSAYFNFTNNYLNNVLKTPCSDISILTANPKANGFYTAKGISGKIPMCYDCMEQLFYNQLENKKNIKLFEYMREKWTFHAKGLWLYSPYNKYPFLTMIGSSNFGERSTERDVETQIILLSEDEKLQKQMEDEKNYLFQTSQLVTRNTFASPERSISKVTQFFISKFVQKFL
ncbi:hypothetical protein ABK040_006780 [Willaertia magna]